MKSVTFIDTEVGGKNNLILDYGAIRDDGATFHSHSGNDFYEFIRTSAFICGHNIIDHDLKYVKKQVPLFEITQDRLIDTLYLSPLLFPKKPYHRLIKDDKLLPEELNNPVNDSIKSRDLLFDEANAFQILPEELKTIYYNLLHNQRGFEGFFHFISFTPSLSSNTKELLRNHFKGLICQNADLDILIREQPAELAYGLAIIKVNNRDSITPPWVIKRFPGTIEVMQRLRDKPCIQGCNYCNSLLNPINGLKKYFSFSSFRKFGGEPLQEDAVKAAIENKSILAVFPTGGGKSLAFQLPALISGETVRGLTVVISPLQSLMKDQVDNLEERNITEAVAISGLLDPIERQNVINRVEDGSASILYIAPESLRSATIEHLLINRNVVRFVIDEAHCFSAWGHDFRVDYMYIGKFINELLKKKNLTQPIPVSCFTATAKRKVIEDIKAYFKEELSLELELYATSETRRNLHYKVIEVEDDRTKFLKLREILEEYDCPSIVYVARTKKTEEIAKLLNENGLNAQPYHGKMEREVKTRNQDAFMEGSLNIMVATSAFGMGVDKDNVGLIIHYDISDSLENYIQEAGRAGRDLSISADCYILYNENDLGKHFTNHNRQKVNIKEIQQVWRAINKIARMKDEISSSALEIARGAGWDDTVSDLETRVLTALSALELASFIRRGQNNPRVFATSIQVNSAMEAIELINRSDRFSDKEKEQATRITRALISSRSRKNDPEEVGESRVDYMSDNLGIKRGEVIRVINLLREEKILADNKDLTAFIYVDDSENKSLATVEACAGIERFLLNEFKDDVIACTIKDLNEAGSLNGCLDINPKKIRTLINFWAAKNWIEHTGARGGNNIIQIKKRNKKELQIAMIRKRHEISSHITRYLFDKTRVSGSSGECRRVGFSILELKEALENRDILFKEKFTNEDIENALLFLSRIGAIKIDGGFMVIYNRLTIKGLKENNRVQYKNEDYRQLDEYYANKVQQIHIVGEYAKKMLADYTGALKFVDDYFQLNYYSFLNKYFPGSRSQEISKTITPTKYRELMDLSPDQRKIINDEKSDTIVVAAGPGSGKTRLLVHKIASLIMLEQVKTDQILVLTFSRAAATEFQKRLHTLLGNSSYYITIRTFHSFCFDLLGLTGSIEKSDNIIGQATESINNDKVETEKITRSVLVIDEAQDMSEKEYELVRALEEHNDGLKIIAVGDDDQNIYEFRKSDSGYFARLANRKNSARYELNENFRGAPELVELTNLFVKTIRNRLKTTPIKSVHKSEGRIKIVNHRSNNLLQPIADDIFNSPLSGTTALLTWKNDEAVKLTALLCMMGVRAKLIQCNDDFNLYNLKEIRWFCNYFEKGMAVVTISDDVWLEALREFKSVFGHSQNYELCLKLIQDFDETNKRKKYYSDLRQYFLDAKLDQVSVTDTEVVYVSTFHKSKGKEFDNIFIMLENYQMFKEENKRALYVAMTRAKSNLVIHHNGNYFNRVNLPSIERVDDPVWYEDPKSIAFGLTHPSVYLDHFKTVVRAVDQCISGEELNVDGEGCYNKHGNNILRFSSSFKDDLVHYFEKGYKLDSARVNHCVYWKPKDRDGEYLIILPEVFLSKD